MRVRSAPPPNAPIVYSILVALGVLAALIGAGTMAYISYRYVTDAELRNPPLEEDVPEPFARVPEWLTVA